MSKSPEERANLLVQELVETDVICSSPCSDPNAMDCRWCDIAFFHALLVEMLEKENV